MSDKPKRRFFVRINKNQGVLIYADYIVINDKVTPVLIEFYDRHLIVPISVYRADSIIGVEVCEEDAPQKHYKIFKGG